MGSNSHTLGVGDIATGWGYDRRFWCRYYDGERYILYIYIYNIVLLRERKELEKLNTSQLD